MATKPAGVAALFVCLLLISSCAPPRQAATPRSSRTPSSPSPTASSSDLGYYEGSIHGWDIGPKADEKGRGLEDLDCRPRQVGAETPTNLDFRITYMPKNIGTPSHKPNVGKWVCGELGLSVMHSFDWDDNPYEGIASLGIERQITAVRARGLYAPSENVEACTIRGLPAVCVHYDDDAIGRSDHAVSILVIEDNSLDPYATTLLIRDAIGIPFDELIKIAEGIR